MRSIYLLLNIFFSFFACAQTPNPPCGLDYGTNTDRENIQLAMFSGTAQDVTNMINLAKDTRGMALGCPQASYGYFALDTTEPSLASIEQVWNTLYKSQIEAYQIGCPEIGRGMPRYGLAALYARQAGYYSDLPSLARIGQMLEAQQYSTKYAPAPLVSPAGLYGYYNGPNGDTCQLTGVAGTATQGFCGLPHNLCITYDAGLYSGSNFSTTDHIIDNNTIYGDIGGAGYDQGWATVFMIENAIQQNDTAQQRLFRESALLAGDWSIQHPLVTNHNYTAKLVWLLAQLYAWTGRSDYKNALIDKLDRNLIPGVLTDWNNDGFVDGTSNNIPFDSLYVAAQQPGRNWDGHNSLPWYQSMNAWAVEEAYVAFRDRGDTALANYYKPYALLMIDNLAYEFTQLGVVTSSSTGWADTPHALLLAIWKIAQYENEVHPDWYRAIWALWNTGAFSIQGDRGINIPLYLLIKTQTPYQPLASRDASFFSASQQPAYQGVLKAFPNPGSGNFHLQLPEPGGDFELRVVNTLGQVVMQRQLQGDGIVDLQLGGQPAGLYTIQVSNDRQYWTAKLVLLK